MNRFLAGCALILALVATESVAATCTLEKIADLPTTMFSMRPLITAKVNGVDERFLIDSGAFYSTISPGSAAEMKLSLAPARYGLMVKGLGGTAQASLTRVKEFTLSGVLLHNVEFIVAGSEFGVAGMIGQNILGLADVEYDLANGVVRLLRPSGCGARPLAYWAKPTQPFSTVDIAFDNPTLPLATTAVYVNGVKLRALFDTGGGQSLLTRSAAVRAGVSLTGPGAVEAGMLSGIGRGQCRIWVAPVDSFKIGDEEIKHTRLVIADTSIDRVDMIIGPDFFLSHHILIAKTTSKAYFTYNGGPVFNLTAAVAQAAAPKPTGSASAAEPLDAAALSRRGTASANRREFEAAITDLTAAIKLDSKNEDYVYERALAYLGSGKPLVAMTDLDRALALKPDDARVLVTRARLRLSGHDDANAKTDLAKTDLDAASKAVAREADIRILLADGYDAIGRPDLAVEQYTLWIAAHPDDTRRAEALNGRCWARGLLGQDLDKALSDCDAAHRALPKIASFLDSRGLVHLRLRKFEKAIVDYDAALAIDPKIAWSLYGRGLAKLKLGDAVGGKADIVAASAIDPRIALEAAKHGLAPSAALD